jgi:large subunit ribosomal protein L20
MKNKHKKILKLAKGYVGQNNSTFGSAVGRVQKGMQYAYRDRKAKKREMRSLWIQRMNAGVREHGANYSWLINGMNKSNIELNRKVLSELAATEPHSFRSVIEVVKEVFPPPTKVNKVVTDTNQRPAIQIFEDGVLVGGEELIQASSTE